MPCSTSSCGSLKWPAQQVGIKSQCEVENSNPGEEYNLGCEGLLYGVQSIGYDANLDPQIISQLGQGALYDVDEGLPTVDITTSKILDGYCPVYLAATKDATEPTLLARAPAKANIFVSYFDCTKDSASGEPRSTVVLKDVQVTSLSYTFGVDSPFSEDVSFTGNNIIWYTRDGNPIYDNATLNPAFTAIVNTIDFQGCLASNDAAPNPKVQAKEDIIFDYTGFDAGAASTDTNGAVCDPDITILPPEVYGIEQNGLNVSGICVQSVSFSADLSREDLFCLGSRSPSQRTLNLPIQVDTTIEVVSEVGPAINFYEDGTFIDPSGYAADCSGCVCGDFGRNRKFRSIRVATCDGTRINAGSSNFLVGTSAQGASVDGENLTVTYTFRNYNILTVMHMNDCSPSGAAWWADRANYLCGN